MNAVLKLHDDEEISLRAIAREALRKSGGVTKVAIDATVKRLQADKRLLPQEICNRSIPFGRASARVGGQRDNELPNQLAADTISIRTSRPIRRAILPVCPTTIVPGGELRRPAAICIPLEECRRCRSSHRSREIHSSDAGAAHT